LVFLPKFFNIRISLTLSLEQELEVVGGVLVTTEHLHVIRKCSKSVHCEEHTVGIALHEESTTSDKESVTSEDATIDSLDEHVLSFHLLCELVWSLNPRFQLVIDGSFCVAWSVMAYHGERIVE